MAKKRAYFAPPTRATCVKNAFIICCVFLVRLSRACLVKMINLRWTAETKRSGSYRNGPQYKPVGAAHSAASAAWVFPEFVGPAWKTTRRGRSRASGYHAAGARRSRARASRASSSVRVSSSSSLWPALVARPRALTRQLWPRPAYCRAVPLLVRSRSWQRQWPARAAATTRSGRPRRINSVELRSRWRLALLHQRQRQRQLALAGGGAGLPA